MKVIELKTQKSKAFKENEQNFSKQRSELQEAFLKTLVEVPPPPPPPFPCLLVE